MHMLNNSTAFPPEPIERPADFPADIPWYNMPAKMIPDPYVYNGCMSPEDYELMHRNMAAAQTAELETMQQGDFSPLEM